MVSPYDIQRHNQQGIADAIAGLGEIFLGNPQLDAQLAQGQAQMALRDKRLTEAEMAREEANRGAMNQDRASRVFHQVAAIDPNSPQFADDMARNVAMLMGTGVYDDPAKYGTAARLFTNIRGGDINQIARGETDLSKLVELEELGDTRAQREALGNVFDTTFGPGQGQFSGEDVVSVLMSELPDFSKQTLAGTMLAGADPVQSLAANTNNVENFQEPDTGALRSLNNLTGEQSLRYSPALEFQARMAREQQGGQPSAVTAFSDVPAGTGGQDVSPAENFDPTSPEFQETLKRPTEELDVLMGRENGPVDGYDKSLFEDDSLHLSSGFLPAIMDFGTRVGGQFTDEAAFPGVAHAKARITGIRARMRPIFTVSNRPSMFELKDINPIFPQTGVFESGVRQAQALTALHGMLSQELDFINQLLADPTTPTVVRNEANQDRVRIMRELDTIGTPRPISGAESFQKQKDLIFDVDTDRARQDFQGVPSQNSQEEEALLNRWTPDGN